VLTQLGRKAEAAAELEVLAQQLLPSSRADAAAYARRALEMNPGARRAQEVLAAADRMTLEAAAPAPVAARAYAPSREEATPEPELIGSGEIELLGDGLPAGDEAADNTGAVAALAEAFGSAEDDGRFKLSPMASTRRPRLPRRQIDQGQGGRTRLRARRRQPAARTTMTSLPMWC